MSATPDEAEARTRLWMERAVVGLNLCPFAKSVLVKEQVHIAVSQAEDATTVLDELASEAEALLGLPAAQRDTTLLVVPGCLQDFLDFNEVVTRGERLLRKRKMEGILQLASFHPRFVFAGAEDDDIGNWTNRAPYPTLHLLREDSIARAVEAFPDPEAIYGRNIETLERLGREGWARLGVDAP